MFVKTNALTKHYAGIVALEDCSLAVSQGEVFGLLGPNGAGKTTLIRLLMGFLHPTSGSATINGLDCEHESLRVRQNTSYLPGDARLFRGMRGREVLEFFAGTRPGSDRQKYFQVADRLDLDLTRRVGFMSTGMRQKLALAATMAAETQLVILDEPTANLDPTVRGEVLRMVGEARRAGRTVMFSSHVLSEVEEACDRVMILRAGRVVHLQCLAELRRRHCIHAVLRESPEPLPQPPDVDVSITARGERELTIETTGELAPLLQWLANLPLENVRIEPVGLRGIYDRFHKS